MLSLRIGKDQDIVKVDNAKHIKEASEGFMDIGLERSRGVG